MRTVSCPLVVVFLFSLPWRLNSKVTPAINIKRNISHITEHQQLTHVAEGPSGLGDYSTNAGEENVVSLSNNVQTQHLTSESEQRISVKTDQRIKRNIDGHNLTTPMQTQSEETTIKRELPSSLTPHDILKTTKFTSPAQPTINIFSQEEKTTRRVLDTTEIKTQETTPEIPSTTTKTHPNVTNGNKSSSNSDTPQSTPDTRVQSSPTTRTRTFTVTPVTDFNETESMKTTQKKVITTERTTSSAGKRSTSRPVETPKTTTENAVLSPNNSQRKNPGTAVAAVIGTTFVLMFIAIVYILLRKRKMQKKQLDNPEWAGPSPFLDVQPNPPGTKEPESVERRGFGQISKYLPQRLSKHLTFQRDTNEEVFMGDILQGSSTFGNHNPEDVQASNGEPTLVQDIPKMEENKGDSKNTESPAVMVDIKKTDHQNDDLTTVPSQDAVVKTLPPLVSIDLDSLSEETAPSQKLDVGNVPPAPPLP